MPGNAKVRWRNRVLILSVFGIAALTLFPYGFSSSLHQQTRHSFLLLRLAPKGLPPIDFVLNVLLFVPFGFGVPLRTRSRGTGVGRSLLLALAAGAVTSYMVEFLQLFIPTRDSSWDDVFSNAIGSVAGALLFAAFGNFILELASKAEEAIEPWVTPFRAGAMLALYFGSWLGLSVVLQKQTRLSNWDCRCSLNVGNDAAGTSPWKGRVDRLQIWDRALPETQVALGLGQEEPGSGDASLLASYDLRGTPPFADQRNFLPALAPTTSSPPAQADPQPEPNARATDHDSSGGKCDGGDREDQSVHSEGHLRTGGSSRRRRSHSVLLAIIR